MREERQRRIKTAHKAEIDDIAEHAPTEKARRHMQHKPYAAVLIRKQGEQIEKGSGDASDGT